MKKFKFITLLILCLACIAAAAFAACTGNDNDNGELQVTFSLNYDGAQDAVYKSVKSDGKVEKPENPTRENYIFLGWYQESICVNEFLFDTLITQNTRVYAKWGLTVATVTFELGYGTDAAIKTVDVGEKVSIPEDPVREDYEFVCWCSDAALNDEFDFNTEIYENTTLYAKWNQLVATVTFFNYTGSTTVAKTDVETKVSAPADPVRADYEFIGWFKDSFCTEAFDFEAIINGDITVYAGWKLLVATITFDENYAGGNTDSVRVAVGGKVSAPEAPEREGYDFKGWFTDPDCVHEYDFDSEVNLVFTLYAKWEAATLIVTFNLGQAGVTNPKTTVVYGELIDMIEDPVRDGYEFTGWFTDAACTKVFVVESIISEDTVIYAGWESGTDSGEYTFTYMLNYTGGGVYETQSYKTGRKVIAPAVPVRSGYYFVGWAIDEAGTTLFNFSSDRARANTVLYAKWFKIYTFEAEYTDLATKMWQGLSDNGFGTQCIISESAVQGVNGQDMGVSNGYYVAKLYYNGAFLEFDITADKAVTDAVLILRLSVEYFDMLLTDTTWQVQVNGTALKYGSLNIDGAVGEADKDKDGNSISGNVYKRPFQDYTLNVSVSLNEGNNVIKLYTNNSANHGGTFQADTPLIDCIYVCSDATLSWTNCYPENVGQSAPASVYAILPRGKEEIYE